MEFALLGWPPGAPTLRLDYRRFAYAGKFVRGSTGTAVVRRSDSPPEGDPDDDFDRDVLAAASFSADRTDADCLVVRYVTVRDDRRGEGLGPRLLAFVATRAADRGYDRVRIAVNNPAAYRAAYRAGFAFTGRETGLAELVCERPAATPADRNPERYRAGLDRYRERDLNEGLAARLDDWLEGDPPPTVAPPPGVDADGERVGGGHEPGR
jgi:GNAT superfamily N-acetyltransferase